MEAKTFTITKWDLHEYYKTLSKQCRIRKIRSKIFNTMPLKLKEEYKQVKNDLVPADIQGKVYKIRPYSNCTQCLQQYLEEFEFRLAEK